jgi:hypothetical protein
MITILSEKIHDNRFLNLIRGRLRAGYLEDWTWKATLSGAPQGGTTSPIMSNIYLHKLDDFVERVLIPQHTRVARRRRTTVYGTLTVAIGRAHARGDREAVKAPRSGAARAGTGHADGRASRLTPHRIADRAHLTERRSRGERRLPMVERVRAMTIVPALRPNPMTEPAR